MTSAYSSDNKGRLIFQSTPSSRKVTHYPAWINRYTNYFNPHLPRGRWLFGQDIQPKKQSHFNPHLPRGRWQRLCSWYSFECNFNPHLPRGRWQISGLLPLISRIISIHTFLAEGDETNYVAAKKVGLFQSTPSSRKVTMEIISCFENLCISIHTFLAEGDIWQKSSTGRVSDFNPHLPRGRWPFHRLNM